MNSGFGVGSGSMCTSTGVRMAAISDQFPAGLRVLVVDDDPTCLKILQKMLQKCAYEVTISNRADKALSLLRGKSSEYDIVLSDVHMPDMDGFKLLEYIGLEMDLPVIMMSADDGSSVVLKGVTHGACDYLIKPVRIEALKTIWQHVVRKKKNEFKELEQSGCANDVDRQQGPPSEDADCPPTANEGNWKNTKRKKDEEDEVEDRDDTSSLKKARVVWSAELHQLFVVAVNQLGIEKAVPKKILELMNIPGLTRENVASHLQKYRLYLRRLNEQTQQQNGLTNSYISAHEAAYGQMHVQAAQAFAAAGHLPPESLATLQGLSRPNAKSGLPMPLVDQRNFFSFETPKLRFEEAQQQKLGNSSKPMNLLFGIPTTMEPQQLSNLHHSNQTFGAVNMQVSAHGSHTGPSMMQPGQPESRGQIQNETSTRGHTSRATLSMPPPISSNGITSGALTKDSSVGDNLVSQAHSMVDLPLNHSADLSGNSFLLGSNPGLSVLKSKPIFHQEVSTNMFNDLHERKSQNWELQGVGLNFGGSHGPQHTNLLHDSLDSLPSVITHQGFISGQMKGHNSNAIGIDGPVFVPSTDFGNMNSRNAGQHLDTLFVDSSSRIKAESVPNSSCGDALFHENFSHEDDLMSAFLKQKGGIRTTDNELDIDDGFSMDNIPA